MWTVPPPPRGAFGGWASPSPRGDDTSVAAETGSGSSRSHFCAIFYRSSFGDKLLRSAACSRSFPSSLSSVCDGEILDMKFPNLCTVDSEVMYELEKRAGVHAHYSSGPEEQAMKPRPQSRFIGRCCLPKIVYVTTMQSCKQGNR